MSHNLEKPAVLTLETMTGKEDRFKKMQTVDSYQDIEVEQDAAGNVTGFVIGGLTDGVDTTNTFNKVSMSHGNESIMVLSARKQNRVMHGMGSF